MQNTNRRRRGTLVYTTNCSYKHKHTHIHKKEGMEES